MVGNVSGCLQYSVQVAENLERVIGGQITRRVLKISGVALVTFFCQVDMVLFRFLNPSQALVEALFLPRAATKGQLTETRKPLRANRCLDCEQSESARLGTGQKSGGREKDAPRKQRKGKAVGLLEDARQVAARPALLAASRQEAPTWIAAPAAACLMPAGMGRPMWAFDEPSLGGGESKGRCHEADENCQRACRLTEVIPRRVGDVGCRRPARSPQ